MKKLILLICLVAATTAAQHPTDASYEKRYQTLTVEKGLFWMDSTNGDLWQFDRENMRWKFIGSPRGANTRRKGNYLLRALPQGELLVLDTDSGEAWWTDIKTWVRIDDPSTRTPKK